MTIDTACARLGCSADGYLPAEMAVRGARVICQLSRASVIDVEFHDAARCPGCFVELLRPGDPADPVASLTVPPSDAGASANLRLDTVRPGRYALQLRRTADNWYCRSDLGPVGPGESKIVAEWREPTLVHGQVRDEEGNASAGVRVRAWSNRPRVYAGRIASSRKTGRWLCGPDRVSEIQSGPSGDFTLRIDPDRETLVVAGGLEDPEGFAARSLRLPLDEPLRLVPRRPATVRARVIYKDETPARCSARLELQDTDASWLMTVLTGMPRAETTCDADGDLQVGPFGAGSFRLVVQPEPGLLIETPVRTVTAGVVEDLGILIAERGESFVARVLDAETEAPIQGAAVHCMGKSGTITAVDAETDANGVAALEGLLPGASLDVQISAAGFRPVSVGPLRLEDSPRTFRLEPAARLAGEVVDASGDPVVGARVTVSTGSRTSASQATAGAGGRFLIEDAPPGTVRLSARAPGYTLKEPLELTLEPRDEVGGLLLVLEAAEEIRGRVVDPEGRPVAGAGVSLEWSPTAAIDGIEPAARTLTAADGEFTLREQPVPGQVLVAAAAGHGPAVEPAPVGEHRREVELRLSVSARLLARLPRGAQPESWIRVVDGQGLGRRVQIGAGTEVPIEDLAPGQGSVALVPGRTVPVHLRSGETTEVLLSSGANVEGRVLQDGRAVPRATVAAFAVRNALELGPAVHSDQDGRYRIEGLEPGRILLVGVAASGREELLLDIPEDGDVEADLQLKQVSLTARVRERGSGTPVAGASLLLTSSDNAWSNVGGTMHRTVRPDPGSFGYDITVVRGGGAIGSTGPAGEVTVRVAAPGGYEANVDAEDYEPWRGEIDLKTGDNYLDIELEPRPARLVRVRLGTDPPGLRGTLLCRSYSGWDYAVSPVSTEATCPDVPAGLAEFLFHVPGFGLAREEADVPAEGDIVVSIRVTRGGSLIVPVDGPETQSPAVLDERGTRWDALLGAVGVFPEGRSEPDGSHAWVFHDLPPGLYTVAVSGITRPAVEVTPGGTARAW